VLKSKRHPRPSRQGHDAAWFALTMRLPAKTKLREPWNAVSLSALRMLRRSPSLGIGGIIDGNAKESLVGGQARATT